MRRQIMFNFTAYFLAKKNQDNVIFVESQTYRPTHVENNRDEKSKNVRIFLKCLDKDAK